MKLLICRNSYYTINYGLNLESPTNPYIYNLTLLNITILMSFYLQAPPFLYCNRQFYMYNSSFTQVSPYLIFRAPTLANCGITNCAFDEAPITFMSTQGETVYFTISYSTFKNAYRPLGYGGVN